jgi:putative DNA methylase
MLQQDRDRDMRLIEAGFPCHQVGAETRRERDTGKAPPTHRLHVWWARRPLTPSRAAVLGSLLPAGADPDWFLRHLGIEKVQALVNGEPWTLTGSLLERIVTDESGKEWLPIDDVVMRAFKREEDRRASNLRTIQGLIQDNLSLAEDPVLKRWQEENQPFPEGLSEGRLKIQRIAGDPYWANQRIAWENERHFRSQDDKYGYSRAFANVPHDTISRGEQLTILDPVAGGGSIPFEALRLGHRVIANDLNPVATVIQYATIDYPLRFGSKLIKDVECWGNRLREKMVERIVDLFPASPLANNVSPVAGQVSATEKEELDGFLYCRQVTCPNCGGEAPLLNTSWLSRTGDRWAVRIVTDGKSKGGKVRFETYRVRKQRGPNGEDPNFATVARGVGTCVHCRQAISSEEIKAQARGESVHGKWQDRLYCVVAVRYQPRLDKHCKPQRYKSGARAGEIRSEKIRFYRPPNEADLRALAEAERRLKEHWSDWERQDLIPTEHFPEGNDMRPVMYGMSRWCDLFTPRQLLGHVTMVEELNRMKPEILAELGKERGCAVITYLQFAIDKGLDYNSRQTRWEYTRGIVKGTFGRHDFSLKWTFGEMIFVGPNSGAAWGLSQVIDAYKGLAELLEPLRRRLDGAPPPVTILNGTAANLDVGDNSVDLICIDPPYYNNVQYAELSDYFYVWQRRTLGDLYPDLFHRRLTNKLDEAVANPARDGSTAKASEAYENLMGEIFAECARVLKDDGIMTVMFTHKTPEAWEAITTSLIENGWIMTSSFPVESESGASLHQKDMASAASSIFLTCRKRLNDTSQPATWVGFGGQGVAKQVREAVYRGLEDFEPLQLNPVDEMVASYGRALQVLSENWPVLDGDEQVSPIRAMNEASAVVAEQQISRLTDGRLQVNALAPEAAMALTLYGIFGLAQFPYDEALNISRSLNISLAERSGNYAIESRLIGLTNESQARTDEDIRYYAPLLIRGSKLRLALPEERHPERLESPKNEWDILHGLIMAYREGDTPVARGYLEQHAEGKKQVILDLLSVWAAESADKELQKEAEAILFDLS